MSKKDQKPILSEESNEKAMSGSQLLIIISLIVIFTAFAFSFFNNGDILNLFPEEEDPIVTTRGDPPIVDNKIVCEEYGTYSVSLQDFLEEYITIEGDTFSEISMKHFGVASQATDIQEVNDQYRGYSLDDELPENVIIYLPNQKYEREGVTAYVKAYGNITIDETEKIFSVSSNDTGTGQLIINTEVEQVLFAIEDGDCVIVEYGIGRFDLDNPVFDVYPQ